MRTRGEIKIKKEVEIKKMRRPWTIEKFERGTQREKGIQDLEKKYDRETKDDSGARRISNKRRSRS